MKLSTVRQKGFTLIELLVVIAIVGILVVGLMVAINPADKVRQASDSRVINDFGALARAAESYSTANSGSYPLATDYATFTANDPTGLVGSGDLKLAPVAPSGYVPYRAAVDGTGFLLAGELKSSKYGSCAVDTYRVIRYISSTGETCTGCVGSVANITAAVAAVDNDNPLSCTDL